MVFMLFQGDKCLADICRPIAEGGMDGEAFDVIRPNATANCCLMTVHTQQEGDDKCFLVEVCEGEGEPAEQVSHWRTCTLVFFFLSVLWLFTHSRLQESLSCSREPLANRGKIQLTTLLFQVPPPPPPAEEKKPSCGRWKMEAYPVLNDGSDILVRSADGSLVPDGVKSLTLVRSTCPPCPSL